MSAIKDVQPPVSQEENTSAMSAAQQASKATKLAKRKSAKAQGAFLTIREVAEELALQQHVLRFWETKFSQIKPLKRGGGRRYYRPEDVVLLKNIKYLLYTQGYTIKGVQKLLKTEGKKALTQELLSDLEDVSAEQSNSLQSNVSTPDQDENENAPALSQKETLEALLIELKTLRSTLVE